MSSSRRRRDHAVRLVSAGQYALVSLGSLNVKSFGAKGDGTTDDTAAIQAALAAVPAAGGQVFSSRPAPTGSLPG
ncbi:pectate lyase-like protein [Pseudonocardia sediminis]|uniref:Pectate lyase-like protein n=1 Tax=Pseudonocardia sediminis TaxID=1397368 RepID=A0A4Q7V5H9_PSEST|nr:glycosyl hydrolase family 28-related protein [Pseudonocardia sediminis]RZT87919.1 pectate lyase-like protein [Pseudonocardia sediminis]